MDVRHSYSLCFATVMNLLKNDPVLPRWVSGLVATVTLSAPPPPPDAEMSTAAPVLKNVLLIDQAVNTNTCMSIRVITHTHTVFLTVYSNQHPVFLLQWKLLPFHYTSVNVCAAWSHVWVQKKVFWIWGKSFIIVQSVTVKYSFIRFTLYW